jgi:hypothetical protein
MERTAEEHAAALLSAAPASTFWTEFRVRKDMKAQHGRAARAVNPFGARDAVA